MPNLFHRKNAQKVFLVLKKASQEKPKKYPESCQEIQENSRIAKNLAKKSEKTQARKARVLRKFMDDHG